MQHRDCRSMRARVLMPCRTGMEAVLMDRPGNAPLPPDHGFRVERSLLRLLQL